MIKCYNYTGVLELITTEQYDIEGIHISFHLVSNFTFYFWILTYFYNDNNFVNQTLNSRQREKKNSIIKKSI